MLLPDLPYVNTVADFPVVSDAMVLVWMDQAFLLLFSFLYVMLRNEWSVENVFSCYTILQRLWWVTILDFL